VRAERCVQSIAQTRARTAQCGRRGPRGTALAPFFPHDAMPEGRAPSRNDPDRSLDAAPSRGNDDRPDLRGSLHAPVAGYAVVEANPVAGWLFAHTGLGTGLLIDSVLTVTAIAYLALTSALADGVKLTLLAVIACCTGFAVVSNLGAITQMGLAPWSGSL
jgi:hypothetical protein